MVIRKYLSLRITMYLLFCSVMCSCNSSKVTSQSNTPVQLANPGPDDCRMKAQILEIYPPKTQEASTSICTKFSCEAKVKILEIKAKGHTFPADIVVGSEIKVHFLKTLVPGKKAYPGTPNPLPGLKKGDIFESILYNRQALGRGFQTAAYILTNKTE